MLSVRLTIGIYNRAILCPPFLFQTYPQFKTYKSTEKYFGSFDYMVVFIFQNDGTKSWRINKDSLCHIDFKKKVGKQLKGTEAGQSREVAMITRKYQNTLKKKGYKTFGLTCGHCDLCGHKCKNRDNPPCKHKGMPSLEATGIDVYQLLKNLNVDYEYPVENTLTGVSSILVRENDNEKF
jgi:predicted metal-binding protein